MKNRLNYLVLVIGLLLVLASFVIYGLRISETALPPGSTPQQVQTLTRQYGLDRPVIQQYAAFLFTCLPGLLLLGLYATVVRRKPDFQHWILTKFVIVVMLVTNTITMLEFLVTAHLLPARRPGAFWLALLVALLALANFAFLLVIWNGYKWGVWAFGINSFVL